MVRKFSPLNHLHDGTHECGCLIVSTNFPASESTYDPEDPESEPFDERRWQRASAGNISLDDGMTFNAGASVKWIGSCQKHAGGIRFQATIEEVEDGQPSYAVIYYACNADLAATSGYEVIVRANPEFAERENGCPLEVRYQGTTLFKRYIAGVLYIAFEHISDDDGGGVYVTFFETDQGRYFSYLHEAGPQIADDQYWGIGVDSGGWVRFSNLIATYNGDHDDGHFCQECEPVNKYSHCDFNVSCGGGTLKTQPGATLVEYDGWGSETCFSNAITPYNEGGWYKQCDGEGDEKDYSLWTFSTLSASFDFPGYGHCAGTTAISATTGFETWRYFRVTACVNQITFTIEMSKSKYASFAASMELEPGCGIAAGFTTVDDFGEIAPSSLGEEWGPSTTQSITQITTCSGSSSTYFRSDACLSEDNDTVTIDLPANIPIGIYRVRCRVSFNNSFTAAPSACSTASATAYPPVSANFIIEGDAMTYDPICR